MSKYGLILPEKNTPSKPIFKAAHNVFGEDSDSDDDKPKKPVLLRPSDIVNRQAKIAQDKAELEDPTVYQYDEVYDSMVSKKETEIKKKKEDKKPKYIENLLKTASKRKIENERRIERQVQKEREKEGEEFADKEVFVTSAYKKKLEELREEEEKEKREEYLESIGDVTKQRDLGGFYRHLYEQKLGSDKIEDNTSETNKDVSAKKEKVSELKVKNNDNKRNYRKRKSDDHGMLSDGEIEDSEDEINRGNLQDLRAAKKAKQENIDADSDFSIDGSSDEDEEDTKSENKATDPESNETDSKTVDIKKDPKETSEKDTKPVLKEEVVEIKPKVDIWKKRTVGELFDQAVIRYYERKATRGH